MGTFVTVESNRTLKALCSHMLNIVSVVIVGTKTWGYRM